MAHRLRMKRFGYKRFYPRPRTPEQWNSLYNAHKQIIPNVEKITLQWSRKGHSAVRYFKYYNITPLQHWNKGLEVELIREKEQEIEPKVVVRLAGGEVKEINPVGLKRRDILRALVALDKDGEIITDGPGFLGPAFHE